jgi:hypothetical protein
VIGPSISTEGMAIAKVLMSSSRTTGGSAVIAWVGSFSGALCNWTRRGRPAEQADGGQRGACDATGRDVANWCAWIGLRYLHER